MATAGERTEGGGLLRIALTAVVAVVALLPACSDQDEAFCDALDADVVGIDTIHWDNGITAGEATWGTVFDDGIIQADEQSRVAAAVAVSADREGYRAVRASAPEELRPTLDRLHDLVLDPASSMARRDAPDVVADVNAVVVASPPDVCGWVR
ncbi:hypothetical protein BH10ACT3_BH10ACT3_12920 [soil metagenome]